MKEEKTKEKCRDCEKPAIWVITSGLYPPSYRCEKHSHWRQAKRNPFMGATLLSRYR